MGTESKLSGFEQRFMSEYRKGKIKVFIVVAGQVDGENLTITLINRLRFGPEVLPIPAWLSRIKAEQFVQTLNEKFQNAKIIEVTHQNIQLMIENREYSSLYPQTISYHLDLQVDETEINSFLNLE